jgi:hypothetical protein
MTHAIMEAAQSVICGVLSHPNWKTGPWTGDVLNM